RFRAEGNATANMVRSPDRALARTPEALLAARLHGRAFDFAPPLRARAAGTAVRHLGDVGLVEDRCVRLDAEDLVGNVDGAQRLAGRVVDGQLHFATCLALRTRTSPPVG